jgi:hypothetical protein
MTNDEFLRFICSLQKNSVADIVPSYEIGEYVEKGLLKDNDDWKRMKSTAMQVLSHSCASGRCLVRTGPGPNDFFARSSIL